MDFTSQFKFVGVGGLDFLRCVGCSKSRVYLGNTAVFTERFCDKEVCHVVLFFDWADYLPVLCRFNFAFNRCVDDLEF